MNHSIFSWLSTLFGIVDAYHQARETPGATTAEANAATAAAALALVQHALEHPHAPQPDAAGGPGPVRR